MRTIPSLTDKELKILELGREDPNYITDYFLRPIGAAKGWRFDENFDDIGAWQEEFFFSSQKDRRCSGGVGTGKTVAAGVAYCVVYPLLIHPNYKFLNVAPVSYQAQQMYQIVLDLARGTPFERLIWRNPEKPYPMIEVRFKAINQNVISVCQYMSIDKNAKNIFSFEGDVIHIDEAGQIDRLEEVIISVGSRLRGSFRGRERLGILSMTTNPWDNDFFWYLFDMAEADPDNNLSMVVSTRHNHNVTKEQLERILARIPESERDRFIDGSRPEGRGDYFSKESIYQCEDDEWGKTLEDLAKNGESGYELSRAPGIGVDYFRTPPRIEDTYMIFGDPGTGTAPGRNAPVIMVWKVTGFPKERAEMVALWWGNGEGQIAPFFRQLARFMETYQPLYTGIDSTATQKNTSETFNALIESTKDDEDGVLVFGSRFNIGHLPKIGGLDFSGAKKPSYLVAARFMMEAAMFRWPKFLVGLRSQLGNYDPAKDRSGMPKIPQDLVATLAMAAHVMRVWFYVDPDEAKQNAEDRKKNQVLRSGRTSRLPTPRRAQRSSTRG